ncbi:hypothetical protein B0H14DRAFT_3134724 [Mycena olivaceomarginata]|nr:hypothetical protein B0H14DRAFT_3134724 [Mycena olivaceomarginata]
MSNGHSVERFCLYQYSFVSLLPGLLQTLNDCGSPPLGAPALSRPDLPAHLRPQEHGGMRPAPARHLRQRRVLTAVPAVTTARRRSRHQELAVREHQLDRHAAQGGRLARQSRGVCRADAGGLQWMDDIVKNVNDGWNGEEGRPVSMMFEGI